MKRGTKALVIAALLLALTASATGVAIAQGEDGSRQGAAEMPAELRPLADQVKAAMQQLKEPASQMRDLMKQVRENRRTIAGLVRETGEGELEEGLQGQLEGLKQEARGDLAAVREAKQLAHALKDSRRLLRTALKAGDTEGARRILESDLDMIRHSAEVLDRAAGMLRARIETQEAVIALLESVQ